MAERISSPPETLPQVVEWARRMVADVQRIVDRLEREKHAHPFGGKLFSNRTVAEITGTGTDQSTASLIPADLNTIAISTTGTGAGRLESARAGRLQWVFNIGTAALSIYPASGERVGTYGTNAAITVGAGTAAHFLCVKDGTYLPARYLGS